MAEGSSSDTIFLFLLLLQGGLLASQHEQWPDVCQQLCQHHQHTLRKYAPDEH